MSSSAPSRITAADAPQIAVLPEAERVDRRARVAQDLEVARSQAVHRSVCEHVPSHYITLEDRLGPFLEDWDASVGPFGEKVLAAMRVAIADQASMLITGPVGCGKSKAAAIISNELAAPLYRAYWEAEAAAAERRLDELDAGTDWNVAVLAAQFEPGAKAAGEAHRRLERLCPIWVSVPKLLRGLRREMGTDLRSAMDLADLAATAHVVVLDDIGASRNTDWAIQTITEIVSERYDNELQTIVTSNVSPQDLADVGLERVVSRLAEDGILLAIGRSAKDYRMTKRRSIA